MNVWSVYEQCMAGTGRKSAVQRTTGDEPCPGSANRNQAGSGGCAVLVPIDQWRRLEQTARPDLKELLLAPEARTDALTQPREKHQIRTSLRFK